jgi:hypothetical protein
MKADKIPRTLRYARDDSDASSDDHAREVTASR